MVVPEYLDIISESLEPLAATIPETSKLLFENFSRIEPINPDSMCQKHQFAECTLEVDGKLYSFHMYEECFLLVEPRGDIEDIFVPVLPTLLIPHDEFEDIQPEKRLELVGDWLMFGTGNQTFEDATFCDSLVLTVSRYHNVLESVFMPNRHPDIYGVDAPVLFQEILES